MKLEGRFEHKLDAKYRVAVPSGWRPAQGESVLFRLLRWKTEGVPVLKVLTSDAFEAMMESINANASLTPGKRRRRKEALYSSSETVSVNDQGKLSIPKRIADAEGLEAGGVVHLFGRGTNFDVVSPRNYEVLMGLESEEMEEVYDDVDF